MFFTLPSRRFGYFQSFCQMYHCLGAVRNFQKRVVPIPKWNEEMKEERRSKIKYEVRQKACLKKVKRAWGWRIGLQLGHVHGQGQCSRTSWSSQSPLPNQTILMVSGLVLLSECSRIGAASQWSNQHHLKMSTSMWSWLPQGTNRCEGIGELKMCECWRWTASCFILPWMQKQ